VARQGASAVQLGATPCSETAEGFSAQPREHPLFRGFSAEPTIEAEGFFVPVEYRAGCSGCFRGSTQCAGLISASAPTQLNIHLGRGRLPRESS
jgi:hypothetical protein